MTGIPLFDRFINVDFYIGDKLAEVVHTPKRGVKPKIYFEWKRVPGDFCYSCQLRITNLYTKWQLFDFDSVVVVAGYTSGFGMNSCRIDCQIFDAYRAEAGPDAESVFDCLVASAKVNLFAAQPYNFLFHDNMATVTDVLLKTCTKMGFTECNTSAMSGKLLVKKWDAKLQYDKQFANEYAVVDYLQQHLSELAASMNHTIQITIFSKKLIVLEFDEKGMACRSLLGDMANETAPVLEHTTNVTWTAGTLTLSAPWNPEIYPGVAFKCSPRLYTGGQALPNAVARVASHIDKLDLYYVITQEVKFSTDGQNTMTILAVPLSNSPLNLTQAEDYAKQVDAQAQKLAKEAALVLMKPIDIEFGKTEIKTPDVAMQNILTGAMEDYQIKKGDTLSNIAQTKYDSTRFVGVKKNAQEVNLSGMYAIYPLIALATYNWYSKTRLPPYQIDPNNPDLIFEGRFLKIPIISSWKSFERNANAVKIYEDFAKYYTTTKDLKSWAKPSLDIAAVLKEGTVNG